MERNLRKHHGAVSRDARERRLGQRGCVVWFTGLSGSGKSTIARRLEERLVGAGRVAYVLDGDNLRFGLNSDLGFSREDRGENVRRTGEVAALFADAGLIAIAALISPFADERLRVKNTVGAERFFEIFVDTPLAECERRDPKGLYAKARANQIADFTGISSPYEQPAAAELVLDAAGRDADDCAAEVERLLAARGVFSVPA